jgi:hypothetical protein
VLVEAKAAHSKMAKDFGIVVSDTVEPVVLSRRLAALQRSEGLCAELLA